MQKPLLLTLFLSFLFLFSFSQNELLVKTGAKGLYIEHTVAPKENFYSIGRAFNVHPKHLARFNGLDMAKGLNLGQMLMVPLSDSNFNQRSAQGTAVYYKSSLKQTVGTVSAISKTPAGNIRSWNKLTEDNIPAGIPVIVGYIQGAGADQPAPGETAAGKTPEPNSPAKPVAEVKKDVAGTQPVKQEETKTVIAKTETPKEENSQAKKEAATGIPATVPAGDGYFKSSFVLQEKNLPETRNATVTSGIFKATNGWTDGKYYALLDSVEPGTIIRVVNPTNSKAIYAKVLGPMNGIRQNRGLDLRISNAAAAALEVQETDKFIVRLSY